MEPTKAKREPRPAAASGRRIGEPALDLASLTPEALAELPAQEIARRVAAHEAAAIRALVRRFGASFDRAVELLAALEGRLIVSGLGKSGHIGAKIAATLTSTGTPATFVHPADALHGDLGFVQSGDVALFLSKSGGTSEVLQLVPLLRERQVPIIAVTAHEASALGQGADIVIDTGPIAEASPFGLVPTSSTTVALVVGDALAIALLVRRGFEREDFASLHPGGVLGTSLTTCVVDRMHTGADCPQIGVDATVRQAIEEISSKRLGVTTVVDSESRLVGVVTDGDLKRIFIRFDNPLEVRVGEVMSRNPRTVDRKLLLADAVRCMEENHPGPITSLVVVDAGGVVEGVLHLHDCLRVGP